jgi:hypothetical protein
MPLYSGFSAILFFASMGLPGLCGFVGEFFVLLAAWNFSPGLAIPGVGMAQEDQKPADAPTEAAKEEESSLANFGKGYYEAPVISFLSNNGEGWDLGKELFGEGSQWDIGGWVQMSTTTNSDGVFNTKPNGFRPQQNWLYFERKADGSKGLDVGFRVDWLYGLDAQNTQSFGNEFGRYSAYRKSSPLRSGKPQVLVASISEIAFAVPSEPRTLPPNRRCRRYKRIPPS